MDSFGPKLAYHLLLKVAKFSVLGVFLLLIFGQNLSTVAYKAVAYKKKNRVKLS